MVDYSNESPPPVSFEQESVLAIEPDVVITDTGDVVEKVNPTMETNPLIAV